MEERLLKSSPQGEDLGGAHSWAVLGGPIA